MELRYASLRELSEELTGVRLAAAVNNSLWSIAATLSERARIAINDAIASKPYPILVHTHSISLKAYGDLAIIPSNIHRVLEIRTIGHTASPAKKLTKIRHRHTAHTNMVYFEDYRSSTDRTLEIYGETHIGKLPANRRISTAVSNTAGTVAPDNRHVLPLEWPAHGYFEMSAVNETTYGVGSEAIREYVRYEKVDSSLGFSSLERGAFGTEAISWPIGLTVTISPVCILPSPYRPALMAEAQANMYNYWAAHRSQYNIYTTASAVEALDIGDIMALVRTYESRADRLYKSALRAPRVARRNPTRRVP